MRDGSMKTETSDQNSNQEKSESQSEDHGKKEKRNVGLLDKLIATIVLGTMGYVAVIFANCNFMIPGSMERADALGGLVNPPPLECKESESRGYNALFTLFTALLGLKARMDD
jgi:hypothetical protein